jgi:hypothetical protein
MMIIDWYIRYDYIEYLYNDIIYNTDQILYY